MRAASRLAGWRRPGEERSAPSCPARFVDRTGLSAALIGDIGDAIGACQDFFTAIQDPGCPEGPETPIVGPIAIGATLAAGGKRGGKAATVWSCHCTNSKLIPLYGTCTFTCTAPPAPGTVSVAEAIIPLGKIQKACPPARSNCPQALAATFSGISIFGELGLGTPSVVANSCTYGTVH